MTYSILAFTIPGVEWREFPRLDLVYKAISSGIADIDWRDAAYQRVLDDQRLRGLGLTPKGIRLHLNQFVASGDCLTVRTETRTEYAEENPYWYRAIIPVAGMPHGLFVEVLLLDDEEEHDPAVEIVSPHEQVS